MSHNNGTDDNGEEENLDPVERTEQLRQRVHPRRHGSRIDEAGILPPRVEDTADTAEQRTGVAQNPLGASDLAGPPVAAPRVRTPTPAKPAMNWWQRPLALSLIVPAALCALLVLAVFVVQEWSESLEEAKVIVAEPLPPESEVIKPIPQKRRSEIIIWVKPEGAVISATSTPTLAEIRDAARLVIRCEPAEPLLVPPGRARLPAPKKQTGSPLRAAPVLDSIGPPCIDRTGQDVFRCCQTVTERLDNYEREFARCTKNPNTYRPPAAKGEE